MNKTMKKAAFFLGLILTGLFLSFRPMNEGKKLSIGDSAPEANLKMASTIKGKVSLLDEKGKNGLLVIFSCNTCPFVVGGRDFAGWEKDYNGIYEHAKSAGINTILVNSNEAKRKDGDSMKDMQKRAKEKEYKMNYLLDKDHLLADAFGAKTTPHIYLFDKDLKLVYTGSIDNTWNPSAKEKEDYLLNAISAFSANKEIENATTAPKGCSIKRKS
jgi:peroxiredoxin